MRHCARGDHWALKSSFDEARPGVLRRDCRSCCAISRAPRAPAPTYTDQHIKDVADRQIQACREFPGLDMDAIYRNKRVMQRSAALRAQRKDAD